MTEHIINDENWNDQPHVNPLGLCGCLPRREAYGAIGCASTSDIDLIAMEDFPRLIREQEANAASLWDVWKGSKIGVLDQNPLSYCWAFSGVEALMIERELMGLPFVPLSPSSVAAPIVGYTDRGWYIEDCLKGMCDQGASSTEFVPAATTNARDFKAGWRESASQNKVINWKDLVHQGQQLQFRFQAMASALLNLRPTAIALNWWSHAIMVLRIRDKYPNKAPTDYTRYATTYLQSWGPSYGDGGCGSLEGSKQVPDAAYQLDQAKFAE